MNETIVSIIIPCWKEDLQKTLDLVREIPCPCGVEWIVAMANPPENWKELVAEVTECNFSLVECQQAGRGNQMNEGAEIARGEMLLFHHCDSDLEEVHLEALLKAKEQEVRAGAYHRILDDRHSWFKHFNPLVRWYNQRWGILFGDQSFLLSSERRSTYYGSWKVSLLNLWMLMLFKCGVSTDKLHELYYKNWKIK